MNVEQLYWLVSLLAFGQGVGGLFWFHKREGVPEFFTWVQIVSSFGVGIFCLAQVLT